MNIKLRLPMLIAAAILLLGGIELWAGIIGNSSAVVGGPVADLPFGRDLRAYMSAGELAADRMGPELYDKTSPAYVDNGASEFVYPPWFAILMIPLSAVPFQFIFPMWSLMSVGLLLWVLRKMDVGKKPLVVVAVLLSIAGASDLFFGQTSFVITAVLLWALLALGSGGWAVAGVALALLAFKPHLLIGIAVWWLADFPQRWREILAALSATFVLFVASALWLPDSWSRFFATLSDAGRLVEPGFEATLLSSSRTLLVGGPEAILVLYAGLSAFLLWGLVMVVRRHAANTRVIASLAISIALLVALHGLPYDWLLLLVAGGLLFGELGLTRETIAFWGLLLGSALLLDNNTFTWQMTHFGFAFRLAPWILLAVTVVVLFRAARVPQLPRVAFEDSSLL